MHVLDFFKSFMQICHATEQCFVDNPQRLEIVQTGSQKMTVQNIQVCISSP